jgi:DNA replication protein DnaD
MKIEKQIRDCFGIENRRLAAKEKEYIDKWCNVYRFEFWVIKFAYEQSIKTIGKLSFAFLDMILSDWYEMSKNDKSMAGAYK